MLKDKIKTNSFFIKIFLLFACVVLVFIFISIAKETYKKNQVKKEIEALQEEAQKINKDNVQIKEKIAYLESPEYQIKEAKDKLGLQNPGENVIVVKPNVEKDSATDLSENEKPENIPQIESKPNYINWWNYFFKY